MPSHKRLTDVLLDIKGVNLSLGGKRILRDVDVTITNSEGVGEVICFLGPSGIGKSVLSRVIAGLLKPDTGEVLLRQGPKMERTAPGKVCVVPQFYPLFDYTSVSTNLWIAGKMGGLTKSAINAKASLYIEAFDLKEHLGKYPKELSGGTKQRVAIARQLMCASNFLIMDEPFSGLDPIMKKEVMSAIVKLSQLDAYSTIIIVTHDVTEGLSIADRAWLMGLENGKAGAKIVESLDLAELGFAWREDIAKDPKFLAFVGEVKDKFQTLKG